MRNRCKRITHRKNEDKLIFTNNLNLIKPNAAYDICIEIFIPQFGLNDIILYNKNFGFELIQNNDVCPINILDDLCLDFIYIIKNQRGKGHVRRLLKFILNLFQIVIHILDSSLGFFEHIVKISVGKK